MVIDIWNLFPPVTLAELINLPRLTHCDYNEDNMELIFLLLAPFLLMIYAPVVLIGGGLGLIIFELIGAILPAFVGGLCGKRQLFGKDLRSLLGLSAKITIGFLVILLGAVLVLQLFFFEPATNWLINKAAAKQGFKVNVGSTRGNLFSGKFLLEDVRIEGKTKEGNDWLGEFKVVNLGLDYLKKFGTRNWAKELTLKDGYFQYQGVEKETKKRNADRGSKQRFGIGKFSAQNIKIDRTGDDPQTLKIDQFALEDLRSEYAVFQIFFRSNGSGVFNDSPWQIVTSGNDSGRTTEWHCEDVPLSVAGDLFGGPFLWLKQGTVDIHVFDEWANVVGAEIDMDWSLIFNDFQVEAPGGNIVRDRIVKYLNSAEQPLDVSFSLQLDKKQLRGNASLGAMGIGDAIFESLAPKGGDIEATKEKSKALIKDFLKKKAQQQ